VPDFSAVGYFFGRKLYDELNVPIGLILIRPSWGGSAAEAWIRRDILMSDPEFEPMMFKFDNLMDKWHNDVLKAKTNNKKIPKRPIALQH
jgi:sialate O-acetylesterase